MIREDSFFNGDEVLHKLRHYLPAQAPLKDFVHHNTLHAFQGLRFYDAVKRASGIFGYKVFLSLEEYRAAYHSGKIKQGILERAISDRKGGDRVGEWTKKLLHTDYDASVTPRIGKLRKLWKGRYHINLDLAVHPVLFRILCSYLDQGISIWNFPVSDKGFLASLREIESNNFASFFRTKRARQLLLDENCALEDLLHIVVGDENYYEQYLFDQQFAHPGWSGMVAVIEDHPETLLDRKKISLRELIIFELLLEIDALDHKFWDIWAPIGPEAADGPEDLFAEVPVTELDEVLRLWQDAYEWSYYDQVLAGLAKEKNGNNGGGHREKSFQAMFCIDDRECSLRTHIETTDPLCETYGTPGFFNVEFFYKPEGGKGHTKSCPGPLQPKYLIREVASKGKREKEVHFARHTHYLIPGWLISQTLGFWSAFKLFLNIFKPSTSPATSSSFRHMDRHSRLTVENKDLADMEDGLQVGFTVEEMAERVEGLLRSISLTREFAPIVYVIGHGASSANNTHYAGYDCGACSGRPGSVNARAFCYMANHPGVRAVLSVKGIDIPEGTRFQGGLHDTTRDEIVFYDEELLSAANREKHLRNKEVFEAALCKNAKERSRRFASINTKKSPEKVHKEVKKRSVSLFEPRPELNHATNALFLVGRRETKKKLLLDRRAFLNTYNYAEDPDGKLLFGILKAGAPVGGGINLEYYFSRVDNQRLGAGTKLPHNVMGLIGVANGVGGDLRPGLPSQMIEVHDPIRLMTIVEHFPEVVLKIIQSSDALYEWFGNAWVHLAVVHPETRELFVFKEGSFSKYTPLEKDIDTVSDVMSLVELSEENLPVYLLN